MSNLIGLRQKLPRDFTLPPVYFGNFFRCILDCVLNGESVILRFIGAIPTRNAGTSHQIASTGPTILGMVRYGILGCDGKVIRWVWDRPAYPHVVEQVKRQRKPGLSELFDQAVKSGEALF